ncbi:hypothetical protein ABT304_21035 [Nocardioides sp. NPDC000445]|uniref:hypothetical protein n=1 Tax=Nocardioides sp. NPDC000445 TaxID=3154257 RepID=UPI00331A34BD
MAFMVTFPDGTEKKYLDLVVCSVDDVGALTITDGEDVRTYSALEWETVAPLRRRAL